MFEIEKVETKEQALEANKFLTKLIQYESKFDKNINEKAQVNEYYEKDYQDQDKCTLLVKKDNKCIGYLYGFIQDRGKVYYEKVAYLDAIYIDEEYRRQNIGESLINEFLKWIKEKNIKYVEVSVFNDNEIAVNLYKKFGFINNIQTMKKEIKQ